MIAEMELSRTTSFDHNEVVKRVMPHYYNWSKVYGDPFLYWFGSKARLAVSDPDMIKEILVSKSGSFRKIRFDPSAKALFGEGLVGLDGDKWIVHRRIAAQAFNMERVKVFLFMLKRFRVQIILMKMKYVKLFQVSSLERINIQN